MISRVYLSGEGASDFGSCNAFNTSDGGCRGDGFNRGPMLELLDKTLRNASYPEKFPWIAETIDAVADAIDYVFIPRGELGRFAKQHCNAGRFMASLRSEKGSGAEAVQAYALGLLAKRGKACLAVIFHDVDGGCAESLPRIYKSLRYSFKVGYAAAEYDYGVCMIPMPRSEGWLICAINGYENCEKLEANLSGNDRSPLRAAKTILSERMRQDSTTAVQRDFVIDSVDPKRLCNMPSFNDFADDLISAVVAKL